MREVKSLFDGLQHIVRPDEPLAPHTWFHVGGPAEYFVEPSNTEELQTVVQRCQESSVPIRTLGSGSNLLVPDAGVDGVVLRLSHEHFCSIEIQDDLARVGGGAKLGHVITASVRDGLAGLESLVGIPGTIGGALNGNAGTRAGDIGQWTCQATVMTRLGEIHTRQKEDLFFAYRQSSLDELVILDAMFQLERENPEELTKRMQKQWIVKNANQPSANQRAGCIFKNPRGMSAGMLIDQAGLKGTRVGQAEISEVHGNFIVAGEGATSEDIRQLIEQVRHRIAERLGVELETEINIW